MTVASRPTPFEIVTGWVVRADPSAPPLPEVSPALSPVTALEEAMMPALLAPPCFVSFSGGRDSSAILAVASRVARREQLPMPIPITLVFPGADRTDESEWQQRVIDHLDMPRWERIEMGTELDFVGPIAGDVVRRHGVLYPGNSHFHVPMFERAAGGSFMIGFDGDGLFSGWRGQRVADVLARRERPVPRDIARCSLAVAPRVVRRPFERRRAERMADRPRSYVRKEPFMALIEDITRSRTEDSFLWNKHLEWYARRRYLSLAQASLETLASDAGTKLINPFLEPRFIASLARAGGTLGWGDRTSIMRALFADVLPREVIERRTKAVFNSAFWCDDSESFVASWNGEGVDEDLVDPGALKKEWLKPPYERSASGMLLQSVWLSTQGTVVADAGP